MSVFGINMTVISGQKGSREIVVAACPLLSGYFRTVNPIANDGNVRPEFLKALEVFKYRERVDYFQRPDQFLDKLVEPSNDISTGNLLWLALDPEGEAMAKQIFEAHGDLPDKRVHGSIQRLNLVAEKIFPPPQVQVPLQRWRDSSNLHYSLSSTHYRTKLKQSLTSYMAENAPLTPDEKVYLDWCESLYEALIPWQDKIKMIQSDLS